ncbi:MAG: hypothetical protein IJT27_10090 [Clostridia bacterium]|nr:hypothetical protein [Clostridia bacterium]
MKKIKIAIIDDGLCADKLSTPVMAYAVVDGSVVGDAGQNEIQESSHGTFCAKIIEKYCPSSVEFVSIRVLKETGLGVLDDLVTALKWCLDRDISIINLSNGISWFEDIRPLYDVCHALTKSGVRIVAAQNNRRTGTYPADFPFVIGVESTDALYAPSLMQSNVYTKSDHKILYKDKDKITQVCNSYACAFATAQFAAIALGAKKTFSSHTTLNCRLSDNAVQWLDNRIEVDAYIRRAEACACQLPFEKQYDVVIDRKGSFGDLENKLDNIRSVIGFVTLPDGFKNTCEQNGILYWDDNYDFGKKKRRTYDVPVIYIKTSDTPRDLEEIQDLDRAFRKEQYVPAVVSDIKDACFYGFIYASAGQMTKKLFAAERYLQPDIVFIVSQTGGIKLKYDIAVEKKENTYVLSYEGKTERTENLFSALKRILSA